MIEKHCKNFRIFQNKRNSYQKIIEFINSDEDCYYGKVLVIFGLRRTGKTIMMEQAMQECENDHKMKCTFYQIEEGDKMKSIFERIDTDIENNTKVIFLDEITNAIDFITHSAPLADVYAKCGIKIIITGTDSLCFEFARSAALYFRVVCINTTHISFSEHCRVLNIEDIDNYIEYGGLMEQGKNEDAVNDYISAHKYLDNSVSTNITNSIKKNPKDNILKELSQEEMIYIIEKLVELYSGKITTSKAENKLNKVTIIYPVKSFKSGKDSELVMKIDSEMKNLKIEYIKKINADQTITHKITNQMLTQLENYLDEMHVLSIVNKFQFKYSGEYNLYCLDLTAKDYYIIQPAIKYYHLKERVNLLTSEDNFTFLKENDKTLLKKKLEEKIKGDMMEQIIMFDTNSLLDDNFIVSKIEFVKGGKSVGEYDMFIYDKYLNKYWIFEIKHSEKSDENQCKHIKNITFKQSMDNQYGTFGKACVLYRGSSFITKDGIVYLKITDFMKALEKYKNIDNMFEEFTSNLSIY